jgi:hypothetical protein
LVITGENKIRIRRNLKGMSVVSKASKTPVRAFGQFCFDFPENPKGWVLKIMALLSD